MNWLTVSLFCALCGTGAALGMAVRRLRLQEQRMEDAAARIRESLPDRRKGGIEVHSEPGHGTTFTLHFPIMTK